MKKWRFILLSLSLFTLGALTGKEMFPTTRRELVIQVLDEEYQMVRGCYVHIIRKVIL